jgi:hypothetical protein
MRTSAIVSARDTLVLRLNLAVNNKIQNAQRILGSALVPDGQLAAKELLAMTPLFSAAAMRQIENLLRAIDAFDEVMTKIDQAALGQRVHGPAVNLRDSSEYDVAQARRQGGDDISVAGLMGWLAILAEQLQSAGYHLSLEGQTSQATLFIEPK